MALYRHTTTGAAVAGGLDGNLKLSTVANGTPPAGGVGGATRDDIARNRNALASYRFAMGAPRPAWSCLAEKPLCPTTARSRPKHSENQLPIRYGSS